MLNNILWLINLPILTTVTTYPLGNVFYILLRDVTCQSLLPNARLLIEFMIHWSQSCTAAASDSMDVQIFRSRVKKTSFVIVIRGWFGFFVSISQLSVLKVQQQFNLAYLRHVREIKSLLDDKHRLNSSLRFSFMWFIKRSSRLSRIQQKPIGIHCMPHCVLRG